jgi:hypothetical protein
MKGKRKKHLIPQARFYGIAAAALILLLILCSCVSVCSGGSEEEAIVTLSGKITVKGSEPNTYLALTAADGTIYELNGKAAVELREEYQNRLVELRGRIVKDTLGPGMPARVEVSEYRLLSD